MTEKTLDELLDIYASLEEKTVEPKRARRRIPKGWFAFTLVLMIAGGAVAAVVLFSHNGPSLTSVAVGTTCPGTLLNANFPPSTGTGNILWTCTDGNAPVIVVGTTVTVAVTGLSAGQAMALVTHVGSATSCSGGTPIPTSGTMTLPTPGSYDYCLEGVGSPSPAWTVTWSQ